MKRILFLVFALLSSAMTIPAFAEWVDKDNVTFNYSPRAAFDRVNRQMISIVTVTNTSDTAIESPMRLLFDSSNHDILNASGMASGVPYIVMDVDSLAAGASTSVSVRMNLVRAAVAFSLRLQADEPADTSVLDLADNQIAVFYQRDDGDYTDWGLHLWNGEGCGNYASPTTESIHFGNWPDPYPVDGIHPEYGAYYVLTIEPGAQCYNFIIHKGDDKALGNQNSRFEPENGQEAFTFHGYPELWYTPITSRPLSVDGARAHWLDSGVFVWLTDTNAAQSYTLYSDAEANLIQSGDDNFAYLNELEGIALTEDSVPTALRDLVPHLDAFTGFSVDISATQAKALAKQQLLAVARDAEGEIVDITRVQIPWLLDALYTQGVNDADEAALGPIYAESSVSAAVWAPTATDVKLHVFDGNKTPLAVHAMNYNDVSGVWTYTGTRAELDRKFYQYELTVYHPLTESIETLMTSDPYSVSLSTNGVYTQFVDLDDLSATDLVPEGWTERDRPVLEAPEYAVIYEAHIRDFSILEESVSEAYRGKYMAFTEEDSAPVVHLKALADAGMTHLHVLPANDIATIEEDESQRVEVTDTVGDLCARVSDAPVCGVESNGSTLLDVLQSYDPSTTDAQALVESMRGLDGFNWGYDPHHFAAPEGSYATDPDGEARVKEMRAMVMALNNMGMQVVLDVVYNHTASSGLFDKSVLDKTVPGYYHRLSETTGEIERSTCCENTATEHRMMEKLMVDSLVSFAKHFGYDGFRFDLMGHIPKEGVLKARDAVREVDADTLFYGEGWNFGEVVNDRRFPQASQFGMAGTEVGTFNDRLREAVRGADLFLDGGSLHQQDLIRLSMAGSLSGYEFVTASGDYVSGAEYGWNGQDAGYAIDPADSIHYISKHDNETLWDQLQYNLPTDMSLEDRVRVQGVAMSIPLLSQGIPFLHMGGELLRSKSMDRNTYDAGDWYNWVDFNGLRTVWNTGLPLAQDNQGRWGEISPISANPNSAIDAQNMQDANAQFLDFLAIRDSSPLFKLRTLDDIRQRVTFHNTGDGQTQGLIVMSLDDGTGVADIDESFDAVLVVVNGTGSAQTVAVEGYESFVLHPVQQVSSDVSLSQVTLGEDGWILPRLTTVVLVKMQDGAQGSGISALPPYGDQLIYLRGDMNGWSTDNPFTYQGLDTYSLTVTLPAGDYGFKIADEFYSAANIGGGFNVSLSTEATLVNYGNNLSISIPEEAEYVFTLNAANSSNPVLTVTSDAITPPPDTGPYAPAIFVRGSMNAWQAEAAYEFSYAGDNVYEMSVNLTAATYNFKIADASWSTVNIGGATSGQTVELDVSWGLTNDGGSQDLAVVIPEEGLYKFTLNAANPSSPELTISADTPTYGEDLFLRGSFNGWSTDNPMTYVGLGQYEVTLPMDADSIWFKVAYADWSTNFGAGNSYDTENWMPMYSGGGDTQVVLPEVGEYKFIFDTSPELHQLRVEVQP